MSFDITCPPIQFFFSKRVTICKRFWHSLKQLMVKRKNKIAYALHISCIVLLQCYYSVISLAAQCLTFYRLFFRNVHWKTWWPWPWPRNPSIWFKCQILGLYVCPFGRESGNTHKDRDTVSKLLHLSCHWSQFGGRNM